VIEALAEVGDEVDDFDVTEDRASSAGRLVNLPTRVTGRSLVPVVLTSRWWSLR
jgi:hypothetical protein